MCKMFIYFSLIMSKLDVLRSENRFLQDKEILLKVDASKIISKTDEIWSCFTMDWWPPSKCDYGYCSWYNNSLINVDLSNKMIRNAILEFKGNAHLRLGGSLGDFVIYNIDNVDGFCNYEDFSEPTNATHAGYEFFSGCLNQTRWSQLNEFVSQTNLSMIFGIDALFGRTLPGPCPEGTNCRFKESGQTYPACCTNWTGQWDHTNAEALIRYTHSQKYPIYAWELGNELAGEKGIDAHISVKDYSVDWMTFIALLDKVYGDNNRPKVVVPDTTWMNDWFGSFLSLLDPSLKPDIVTHHLYSLGAGSDPNVWTKTIDASYLDKIYDLAEEVQTVVNKASPASSIWLGEAGGAYNSGRDNVTNSFNSGFWYLDQMAIFAARGHGAYCRQTLVGGHYSLLDYFSYEPNPDYYNLLLWSRLMGSNVLETSSSNSGILRAYAHCTRERPGAVTLLLINLSNSSSVTIAELNIKPIGNVLSFGNREEYILSSAAAVWSSDELEILQSKQMLLNGNLLKVDNFIIPTLNPRVVSNAPNSIAMNLLTYGYFVFPDAGAQICL